MQKTIKRRLVEHMLANGNSFRYTDMIKWIVENTTASKKYNWRTDRGYYATNFDKRSNGYMINGGGDCTIYKCKATNRWKAKLLSKREQLEYKVTNSVHALTNATIINNANKQYHLSKIDAKVDWKWEERDIVIAFYGNLLKSEEAKTTKKIVKAFETINKSYAKSKNL